VGGTRRTYPRPRDSSARIKKYLKSTGYGDRRTR
jgi:hypothetical protein